MTRVLKAAGLAEVAGLAGVSRTRAGQIAAHPDFPEPVLRLAMGPVWLEADVKAFLAKPRKAGRKPKVVITDAENPPMVPPECEHAYTSIHEPGHRLYWVRQCMACHAVDWNDLDEQIAALIESDSAASAPAGDEEINPEENQT